MRHRWTLAFRGSAWGALAAFALAVATYVAVVHMLDYAPGLSDDRYMAASLILGAQGTPLSFALFGQIGNAGMPLAGLAQSHGSRTWLRRAALAGVIAATPASLLLASHRSG